VQCVWLPLNAFAFCIRCVLFICSGTVPEKSVCSLSMSTGTSNKGVTVKCGLPRCLAAQMTCVKLLRGLQHTLVEGLAKLTGTIPPGEHSCFDVNSRGVQQLQVDYVVVKLSLLAIE